LSIFWQSCPFGKVLQLVIQNSSTLPVLGQATTKMQSNRCTPSAALVPLWNAKKGSKRLWFRSWTTKVSNYYAFGVVPCCGALCCCSALCCCGVFCRDWCSRTFLKQMNHKRNCEEKLTEWERDKKLVMTPDTRSWMDL